MKIKIGKNIKTFNMLFGLLNKIGLETNMVFKEDGLSIIGSDASQMAGMIILKPEFFDEYEVAQEESFPVLIKDISMPIAKLKKEVEIYNEENKIVISAENGTYKIPILSEAVSLKTMPEIEYDQTNVLNIQDIWSALDKLKIIDTQVATFYTEDNKLKTKAVSDNKTRESEVVIGDFDNIEGESHIGINLLEKVITNTDQEITLFIKEDTPLSINYSGEGYSMLIMIAPRVGAE